jgi:membrane associated rhomboid family serine protease
MLIPLRSNHSPAGLPFGSIALMVTQTVAFAVVAKNWTLPPEALRYFTQTVRHIEPDRIACGLLIPNNVLQLLLSLWFLYLVGFAVEGWMRTPKFLALYFVAGLAGCLAKLGLATTVPDAAHLIGPSSAMLGVIGAAIYLLPYTRFDVWDRLGLSGSNYGPDPYADPNAGRLYRFWRRRAVRDPIRRSAEASWPLWGVGLYFIVLDFMLTWMVASPASYLAVAVGFPVGLLLPWMLHQDKEDIDLSDAMAVFSETRDLGLLSPIELYAMHRADPGNTTILLNWMHKNLLSRWGVAPECMEAFRRNLPSIMANEPPEAVASVFLALNRHEALIESRYHVYLGSLLEKKKHNQMAIDIYESVRKNVHSAPEDVELALFRLGKVYETALFNPFGAAPYYREMLDRFPLGPLAPEAKARLAVVRARLPS